MTVQRLSTHFFTISLAAVLYFGWMKRDDNYLSAENGAGYMLGIIGGSLMLILLLYPLSKRVALFTRWIPIRYWFGIHMLFGIIGPLMILFHSNFHLGSTNSSVAMICMLLVAASGLIGRYIYAHIHHGLYGLRITLKELNEETEDNHSQLLDRVAVDDTLKERLDKMEKRALQPYTGMLTNLGHIIYLALAARRLNREVAQLINSSTMPESSMQESTGMERTITMMAPGRIATGNIPDTKSAVDSVNRYTRALRRIAAFKFYERMFSLWHILHLPLFIMMIITAVIHIFAVHMY
jgi:hypothetical protein